MPLSCPPFAKSESGQLARLIELETSGHCQSIGGFAAALLGGPDRVLQLRGILSELSNEGVECVIVTRGYVGPIRKCLEFVGLLPYFSAVWGNIGDINGNTEYDQNLQVAQLGIDALLLGTQEMNLENFGRSKQKVIAHCLKERGLGHSDAVFVDDTWEEIQQVSGTCGTIQVQPPQGLGQREIDMLRNLLLASSCHSGGVVAPTTAAPSMAAPSPAKGLPGPSRAHVRSSPTNQIQSQQKALYASQTPSPLPPVPGGSPSRDVTCGNSASKVAASSSTSLALPLAPAALSQLWSPQLPRVPDWSEMGLGSILPPELLKAGEQQLREEEERLQQVKCDPHQETFGGASSSCNKSRVNQVVPKRPEPLPCRDEIPEAISEVWMAGPKGPVPPVAARRCSTKKRHARHITKDGEDDDWLPLGLTNSILGMDGCYRQSCGPPLNGFSRDSLRESVTSLSEDDEPVPKGEHKFLMEIADDRQNHALHDKDNRFRAPCCHQ